jgi:hypothetical protein
VSLQTLLTHGIFSNRPPQSIARLTEARYLALKPFVQLGFSQ